MFLVGAVLLNLLTVPVVSLFTLSTLFAELRVGKARAKRLEDLRSRRDYRHVYSLLAGIAATIQRLSWLAWHP